MTNIEKQNLVIKNTIILYIRMFFVMIVTLYTSRLILDALGAEDFGIYNVVGGVVSVLGFFTSSLSNATLRYLSIGIGKNNMIETNNAFCQSVSLYLIISIGLIIVSEIFGYWFINNKLIIPLDRIYAAKCVFQLSLFSIFISINQIPFFSMIIAKERMSIYTYWGLFEVISKLIVVILLLTIDNTDRLILYAALLSLVSLFTFIFYFFYCTIKFPECVLKIYWNKDLVKEVFRYISYNLFGCFAWSAGIQGINIVLNMFFGPVVNAARAIAVQINGALARFTESLMTAIKPQIIKSYAENDYEYMTTLLENSSKYSFFFLLILSTPILFETDIILNIWLKKVPEHTVAFTRLILFDSLIGVLIPLLATIASATGRIKNIQVYGRMITLLVLPVSYFFLKRISLSPIFPLYIVIIAQFFYLIYNLYDICKQIKLNFKRYFSNVLFPILKVSLCLTLIILIEYSYISNHLCRFVLILITAIIIGCSLVFFIGMSDNEKNRFLQITRNSLTKK